MLFFLGFKKTAHIFSNYSTLALFTPWYASLILQKGWNSLRSLSRFVLFLWHMQHHTIRLRHVRVDPLSLDDSTANILEIKTRQGIMSFVELCFLLLFRSSNPGIWLVENLYVL